MAKIKKTNSELLEIADLERACQRAVTFLENSIVRSEGEIGWHQILGGSVQRVGWVGSAVGLLTLVQDMRGKDYFEQIQSQLLKDQFRSTDPTIDGGWSIRIISEFPVLEGTAWVVSGLVATHCRNQEAIDRAYDWIARNQNKDGGWGSTINQSSRTHLTCLALRTLYSSCDKFTGNIQAGIDWLKRTRNEDDGGWGELPGRLTSCFHTAYVLYTLQTSPITVQQDILDGASQYLLTRWDPRLMWDQEPLSEQYDIVLTPQKWFRIRNYNFPTAWSVIALTAGEAKQGILRGQVWHALNAILKGQEQLGYWRHSHDHENIYIWGIHDNTLALRFFQHNLLARDPMLKMQLLQQDTIIISHGQAQVTLARLALKAVASHWLRWLRKNWRVLTFATYCLVALVLLLTDILTWRDVLLGLIVPFLLLVWQVALTRKPS